MSELRQFSRRQALVQGGSALAALAFFDPFISASGREGEKTKI